MTGKRLRLLSRKRHRSEALLLMGFSQNGAFIGLPIIAPLSAQSEQGYGDLERPLPHYDGGDGTIHQWLGGRFIPHAR